MVSLLRNDERILQRMVGLLAFTERVCFGPDSAQRETEESTLPASSKGRQGPHKGTYTDHRDPQQERGHCQRWKLAGRLSQGLCSHETTHTSAFFSPAYGASSASACTHAKIFQPKYTCVPISSFNFPLPPLEVHTSPMSHTDHRLRAGDLVTQSPLLVQ